MDLNECLQRFFDRYGIELRPDDWPYKQIAKAIKEAQATRHRLIKLREKAIQEMEEFKTALAWENFMER